MRTVIVVVGPRGAGKTTLCKSIIADQTSLSLIERDEIARALFGGVMTDPHTQQSSVVQTEMYRRVQEALGEDLTVLLDTWVGSAQERSHLVRELRRIGAERVVGWVVTTPEEVVVKQFLRRESLLEDFTWSREVLERSCRHDYQLFHAQLICVSEEEDLWEDDWRFDQVREINPLQGTIVPHARLLL